MTEQTIIVNGKTFKLRFGLKVSRLLGEKWGLDSFDEVIQRLSALSEGLEKLEFSSLYTIFDVVIACTDADDAVLTTDELEAMFDNNLPDLLVIIKTVFEGYMGSLKKLNVEGEKKPKPLKGPNQNH
jgi:hypothetical protein